MSTLDVGGNYGGVQRPRGGVDRSAFTIGGVLRRLTSICLANGGTLLVLAIVLWAIPLAFGLVFGSNTSVFSGGTSRAALSLSGWLLIGLGAIVAAVTTIVLEGAIIHVSTAGRGGWDFAAPLRTGLRYFWPNMAIYILRALAISLASFLLLVPGLMLACRWLVAIQAAVAEGAGVRGALRRSRDLTRGHRWRIFGLVLIGVVIAGLLALGQFLLARALGGSGATRVILVVLSAPISVVESLINYVGGTAVYLELRDVKEGGTTREIAAVFE